MDESLHLKDLIPRNSRTYARLAILCLACVLGLASLHVLSRSLLAGMTTDNRVAALDLDAEGNLAAWFSFAVLFLAGQTALILHHIARSKPLPAWSERDRRRAASALLFTSFVCFLMSLDEGASLHEGFKEMIARILGTPLYGDGSIFWIVPYFLLLAVMGWRLIGMMGTSPAGLMLLATGGLWALAIANQLEWFFANAQVGIVVEECSEMLGHASLLGSLCLLGRQWLDAADEQVSVPRPVSRRRAQPRALVSD